MNKLINILLNLLKKKKSIKKSTTERREPNNIVLQILYSRVSSVTEYWKRCQNFTCSSSQVVIHYKVVLSIHLFIIFFSVIPSNLNKDQLDFKHSESRTFSSLRTTVTCLAGCNKDSIPVVKRRVFD